jgi:AcrR family transcriptional regulator
MTTSRRRYHHGNLRPSILQAAAKLLEKHGVDRLSLRAAARLASVSHNAPYRHFPTKGALLAALAAAGFERFRAELDAAEQAGGFRARGEAYIRFALANPQHFRLMFGSGLNLAKDGSLHEQAARAFGGLERAIAAHAGQEAPHAAIAAWALVHGLSHLLLDEKLAGTAREAAQAQGFVRAVLASVRFSVVAAQPA